MEELLEILETKCKEIEADGVKIYFHNENDYCIKFVKGDSLLKVIRKGHHRGWDLKERKNNEYK